MGAWIAFAGCWFAAGVTVWSAWRLHGWHQAFCAELQEAQAFCAELQEAIAVLRELRRLTRPSLNEED
jgi:hypothetical protein